LQADLLIVSAAREAIAKGLSTRETEKLVRHLKLGRRHRREPGQLDPNLRALVEKMQRTLGTKVRLIPKARSKKGKIEIEYYSADDLDRIIQSIAGREVA
jgi:ParB family chromosome partitioning protein